MTHGTQQKCLKEVFKVPSLDQERRGIFVIWNMGYALGCNLSSNPNSAIFQFCERWIESSSLSPNFLPVIIPPHIFVKIKLKFVFFFFPVPGTIVIQVLLVISSAR